MRKGLLICLYIILQAISSYSYAIDYTIGNISPDVISPVYVPTINTSASTITYAFTITVRTLVEVDTRATGPTNVTTGVYGFQRVEPTNAYFAATSKPYASMLLDPGTYVVPCSQQMPGSPAGSQISFNADFKFTPENLIPKPVVEPVIDPSANYYYNPSGSTFNYVMSSKPLTAKKTVTFYASDEIVQTNYVDGLGRLSQTVQKAFSPDKKDLVSLTGYDVWGRESRKWLPISISANGAFVTPATLLSNAAVAYNNDTLPCSQNLYESSPLSRIIKKYAPGMEWKQKDKAARTSYMINTTSDSLTCAYYFVSGSGSSISLNKNGNYNKGELFIVRSEDEDGNVSFVFKDKQGQIVLTRQINNGEPYDTYYVYDDFGNKCFVLPPLAADNLTANATWNENSDIIKKYAYVYKYNDQQLCSYKVIPGTDYILYIYDKKGNLIFTQDGELRKKGQWKLSVSDAFGRPALTAVCSSYPPNASALGDSIVYAKFNINNSTYKYYDIKGLTLPGSIAILSATFYDNYNFMGQEKFTGLTYDSRQYNTRYGTDNDAVKHKGLLTGSINALLYTSGNGYIYSTYFYDSKRNLVQKHSTDRFSGTIMEYNAYSFTGLITSKKIAYNVTGKIPLNEVFTYSYDQVGRLTQTLHQFNGVTSVILQNNTYDALGRSSSTTRNNSSKLTSSYDYNVRSWLTRISNPNSADKLFEENIAYNTGTNNKKAYNGNISSMTWWCKGDVERSYNFSYDNLSHIISADYFENSAASDKFNIPTISYDKHGNITQLKRCGKSTSSNVFDLIDDLSLTYNGNQLIRVQDAATDPLYSGAFNFVNGSDDATEYVYDTNGNVIQDKNKKIAIIKYNLLNLPDKIQFTNGNTISYLYDASGTKRTVTYITAIPNITIPMGSYLELGDSKIAAYSTTEYYGNLILENGLFTKILNDEGYLELKGSPNYYFYLKDHLGNNRVVCDQNGTISQVNNYYPFGMNFGEGVDNSNNRYKYNGKELEHMHGLDWYDYGARNYDSAIGRWETVDPLAEKKPWISPYVYCRDNPINMIDPDGRDEEQRKAAIAKAQEYVKKNPGDSYHMGAKGSPGHKVDCSGLVSNSVKAGGENDPNNGNANGVKNIENNTQKKDIQDAQAGNIITFSKSKHTGVITEVIKNKEGNITGFKFIDSGGTEGSGKSGPRNSVAIIGKNYWGNRISGIFKWDTKPDKNEK